MECDRAKELWLEKEAIGYTKSNMQMILISCEIRYASLFVSVMSRLQGCKAGG
jgi:hypothetical protein